MRKNTMQEKRSVLIRNAKQKGGMTGRPGAEFAGKPGIRSEFNGVQPDPAELTLLGIISPFFPSHIGECDFQRRGYIRSSALGRGRFPAGAPGKQFMKQLLKSEGFSTGGREGHIYAPWSKVNGKKGADLRRDLDRFVRTGAKSLVVERMLIKIRREARWN